MAARSRARASRPPPCGPPPPHLRRRENPCRLIRFKKNGAQILEERFNNGRHVWWVAAPDGAQMELIEKASDGAAPHYTPANGVRAVASSILARLAEAAHLFGIGDPVTRAGAARHD